jgi:Protease inhibitor Inh
MLEPAISGMKDRSALIRSSAEAAAVALAIVALVAVGGCANHTEPAPEAAAAPTPPPPPPQPPPVSLNGRWRLTAAGTGACLMNFAQTGSAAGGTIAPEGGCPGNFFTSRKWTFEHGALIIRDHKSEALAELSFAGGRFEGRQAGGGALSLSR